MQDMLEIFRVVCINLSLLDAIMHVPVYARFLKELCTQKRSSRKILDSVMLSEEVSSIVQRRIPAKMADPGTPIIPCVLGNIHIERVLLDLGASMNVLHRFFYDALQLGKLKPTTMTIQLADRSVKVPKGVLKDVLLKVEDFIFPINFVVLDIEGIDAEHQTPIILGRPFLATANACINYRTSVLEISFDNKRARLNVFHAAMGPAGDKCISFTDTDDDVDEVEYEVMMSIFTCCIVDPGPEFTFDDVDMAVYTSSLAFLIFLLAIAI
ncbi:unnamed protein product [Victoria cruziana]